MLDSDPALVVNVSLTGAAHDYDQHVTFLDRDVRILRVGTSGDVAAADDLVRKWAEKADAIAVTGVRESREAGLHEGELAAIARVVRTGSAVPVTDGRGLGDVLDEWAIRHVQTEMPGYFDNARTVILGGSNHERATQTLRHFTSNLEFADPLLRLDLPARLHANPCSGSPSTRGCGRSERCRADSARSRPG